MRDVVGTRIHHRRERHGARHVSGHGHPDLVRATDDRAGDVRLDERVQLHLLEAGGMIGIDDRAPLPRRVRVRRAECFGPASIYQSREQQAWSENASRRDRVAERHEGPHLATHVARRRDTDTEVGRPPLGERAVGVHVPETGDDRLAAHVDGSHARGHCERLTRADGRDAAIANDHRTVLDRRARRAVDDPRANQREVSLRDSRHRRARARRRRHFGANGIGEDRVEHRGVRRGQILPNTFQRQQVRSRDDGSEP
jgi:hypothetical protein